MDERRIHQVFTLGVVLKGAHAVIECLGGLALAVVSASTISALVEEFTQDELTEDPNDFVATHLYNFAQHFSVDSQHFYAFYLLSHGMVKLLLVIGLLRKKLWSYPVSIVVMMMFVAYQLYRFTYTGSYGLVAISALDVVVIVLTWHEYHLMGRHVVVGQP